jgi:hypothetical protein
MDFMLSSDNITFTKDRFDGTYIATIRVSLPLQPSEHQSAENLNSQQQSSGARSSREGSDRFEEEDNDDGGSEFSGLPPVI